MSMSNTVITAVAYVLIAIVALPTIIMFLSIPLTIICIAWVDICERIEKLWCPVARNH
jgi:hypothetical protein